MLRWSVVTWLAFDESLLPLSLIIKILFPLISLCSSHHFSLSSLSLSVLITSFLSLCSSLLLPLISLCIYSIQDEAYDYFTKHGTYPGPEYHQPFSSWLLWKMRLNILFWGILLFVIPCLLILLYFSWAYIIVLSLLALLCEYPALPSIFVVQLHSIDLFWWNLAQLSYHDSW